MEEAGLEWNLDSSENGSTDGTSVDSPSGVESDESSMPPPAYPQPHSRPRSFYQFEDQELFLRQKIVLILENMEHIAPSIVGMRVALVMMAFVQTVSLTIMCLVCLLVLGKLKELQGAQSCGKSFGEDRVLEKPAYTACETILISLVVSVLAIALFDLKKMVLHAVVFRMAISPIGCRLYGIGIQLLHVVRMTWRPRQQNRA
ncbi:hypothetical protein EIP91_004913 [Steccherinum ochraceum]|uniref:Uncharacterized protein n=1 Tax=Steccherinum ochraceum TaxID=92696 RepID=A0A4R0RJ50_9APHY|nr:hypothetical protein EIP91_004913 [Steccherinum ochraceum]